jgi:hypothetical protein
MIWYLLSSGQCLDSGRLVVDVPGDAGSPQSSVQGGVCIYAFYPNKRSLLREWLTVVVKYGLGSSLSEFN